MPAPQLVEIAAELKHETKLSWLINDGKTECWIPKSMCEATFDRNHDGIICTGTFTIPLWMAQQKGLI